MAILPVDTNITEARTCTKARGMNPSIMNQQHQTTLGYPSSLKLHITALAACECETSFRD